MDGVTTIPNLERETGFEPATLSLGTVFTDQRSRENPLLFEDLATPRLRRNMTLGATPEGLLPVREAARRLEVSTATVYKACAGGRGMVGGPGLSTREGSP